MEKLNLRSNKFKDTWDSTNLSFSWPQRNYTCSFCKKQFKSAQALGGHMNVHRRDRAKLRQSPSWDSSNPNPNFSSSPAARFLPYVSNYHSSLTPSPVPLSSQPSASTDEEKLQLNPHSQLDPASPPLRGDARKKLSNGTFIAVGQPKSLAQEGDSRVLTKRENINVRLDLDMSLLRDAKVDLDLELRLGYS